VPPAEADAERRAAEADQFRSERDTAAEQMGEELTAAQARTSAAEADQGAAVAKIRAEAEAAVARPAPTPLPGRHSRTPRVPRPPRPPSRPRLSGCVLTRAEPSPRARRRREREELLAELRARAEHLADAYRDELTNSVALAPTPSPSSLR
jgi:hypothetical protein